MLQISRNRFRFSGTNKQIAWKLGLPVIQNSGSYHKKFVGATRLLPCNVVKLQISRVRVRFSGTKKRIAFKHGVQVAQITGSCSKNCGHYTASLQGCDASNF